MRNENGITLVELLAALAIVGVIIAVVMSVLLTGTSSADRTSSKQQLQQEANYIVEVIRSEYLKQSDEPIMIISDNVGKKLKMDGKTISDVYKYTLNGASSFKIERKEDSVFELLIEDGDQSFVIKTTFSKLR